MEQFLAKNGYYVSDNNSGKSSIANLSDFSEPFIFSIGNSKQFIIIPDYGVKFDNYGIGSHSTDLQGSVVKVVSATKGGAGSTTYAILFESGRVEVFPAEELGGDISEVASDLMSGVQDIVGYANGFAALKSDGGVIRWGHSTDLSRHDDLDVELQSGVEKILSTRAGVIALKENGSVIAWGGDGFLNYPHVYSDEVISNLQNNVEDIFANLSAALAIKSDGSIVSWGDDRYGQAIDISNFSDVAQLVSSEYAFAARFTDGTVKVWDIPRIKLIK